MDLPAWVRAELDDTSGRLRSQILGLVPADRRHERPDGGGNAVVWSVLHVARHADLALAQLTGEAPLFEGHAAGLGAEALPAGGAGLDEAQQGWAAGLDPGAVDAYLDAVLGRADAWVAALPDGSPLDAPFDAEAALGAAGIDPDSYAWLYRMWEGKPVGWLLRWSVLGHMTTHVGEMLATRNRMGLSPF